MAADPWRQSSPHLTYDPATGSDKDAARIKNEQRGKDRLTNAARPRSRSNLTTTATSAPLTATPRSVLVAATTAHQPVQNVTSLSSSPSRYPDDLHLSENRDRTYHCGKSPKFSTSTSSTSRPRAKTIHGAQTSPLLSAPEHSAALGDYEPSTTPSTPPIPTPTLPIAIPGAEFRQHYTPTTPLTGRVAPGHHFPHHYTSRRTPTHLRVRGYNSGSSSESMTTDRQSTGDELPDMSPRSPRRKMYQPSSPLAPPPASAPIPIPGSARSIQQRPNRPAPNLKLSGLPKYHPANFPNSTSNHPLSPRSAHGPGTRPIRAPDPQQHIQHYRRDMIANLGRQSPLGSPAFSSGLCAKPTSPRLLPAESPAASMTPLALEAQGDYLLPGGVGGKSQAEARELIERIVQKENERRYHPEARSDTGSPAISPAMSPAVTPAA